MPFEHIGALLKDARYAVLVPERRGYGRSDGLSWPTGTGATRGRPLLAGANVAYALFGQTEAKVAG